MTAAVAESPWPRHVIDASSRGADGARLGDFNGDGLPDVVTPWEQGAVIRIAFHPGYDRVRETWPSVEVGRVGTPEDAVPVDIDNDGQLDVVSACEGNTRSLFVHWAPKDSKQVMNPDAWETEIIPVSEGMMQFMYSLPLDVNQDGRVDLVTGGKGKDAALGWFESPENPRDLEEWIWHEITPAGWIMSIRSEPHGPDNTPALLISDRRGDERGIYQLFPIGDPVGQWQKRLIGGSEHEVLFLDYTRHPPNRWTYAWATRHSETFLKLTI
ncbi:MAG: VCBS repeat-containing protein, partial [Candidatus Hydrogenedentota bacterium]